MEVGQTQWVFHEFIFLTNINLEYLGVIFQSHWYLLIFLEFSGLVYRNIARTPCCLFQSDFIIGLNKQSWLHLIFEVVSEFMLVTAVPSGY